MQPLVNHSEVKMGKPSVDQEICVKIVPFGSKEYYQSIDVRFQVLRKPLGIGFDPKQLAQENNDYHIVAFDGDKAIGTLILSPYGDAMKMRQVSVLDTYQNRGVGAQLVEVAETVCKDLEAKTIVLHARETAVPFYLKLAYLQEGERFMEVGIPHFKMFKDL